MWIREQQGPPLIQILRTQTRIHGENEVHIWMDELSYLITGGAFAARVPLCPILTVKVFQECQCQFHCSSAVLFFEHDGVSHLVAVNHALECPANSFLSLYLCETHIFLIVLYLAILIK